MDIYFLIPTFVSMNFRKHISIVLASLILLANLGLSFAVHYCKDEIASVSFQYHEDQTCVEKSKSCCAKEDSHDSCCSNKLIKVEKKTDDILVKTFQLDLIQEFISSNWNCNIITFNLLAITSDKVAFYCDSHAPPLYKLYCQLVFYS